MSHQLVQRKLAMSDFDEMPPVGSIHRSDWSVNIFIMVVLDNFLLVHNRQLGDQQSLIDTKTPCRKSIHF